MAVLLLSSKKTQLCSILKNQLETSYPSMILLKNRQSLLLVTSSEEIMNSGNPKYKFWMLGKSESSKNWSKDRTDMLEGLDDSLSYANGVNLNKNI